MVDIVWSTTSLREDEYQFPPIHDKIPIQSLELSTLQTMINDLVSTLDQKNEF